MALVGSGHYLSHHVGVFHWFLLSLASRALLHLPWNTGIVIAVGGTSGRKHSLGPQSSLKYSDLGPQALA